MKNIFFLLIILTAFIRVPFVFAQDNALPDRLIVKFKEGTSDTEQSRIVSKFTPVETRKLRLPRRATIELKTPKIPRTTIEDIAKESSVEYVEPDAIAFALDVPNDPKINSAWGLAKIHTFTAWNSLTNIQPVLVAVVDSGVNTDHPDLVGQIQASTNLTNASDGDSYGHGTHVAGIIGAVANNAIGISGVAPQNKLLSVKVLDNQGRGYYSWIADGIIWAVDHGAKIINLSLGGTSTSQTLLDAISYAASHNATVVAAAGNNNNSTPIYPAFYASVIAVGATDRNDKRTYFSTYGDWVDIAAPGVSILSTYKSDYAMQSGTSMASPFVAGVVSMVAGLHPDWSIQTIRDKVESNTDPISMPSMYGHFGRINACKAVDCIETFVLTPTPIQDGTMSLDQVSIDKNWNPTRHGTIDVFLRLSVRKTNVSDAKLRISCDSLGTWNLLRGSSPVIIQSGSRRANLPFSFDVSAPCGLIDLSSLSIPIQSNTQFTIRRIQFTNDTRGHHTITIDLIKNGFIQSTVTKQFLL